MVPGGAVTVPLDRLSGPVVSIRRLPVLSGRSKYQPCDQLYAPGTDNACSSEFLRVDPGSHRKVAFAHVQCVTPRNDDGIAISVERHCFPKGRIDKARISLQRAGVRCATFECP